jgi:hypothetical protein
LRLGENRDTVEEVHAEEQAQSISQFALKPGDEEIKKKGWWNFWK